MHPTTKPPAAPPAALPAAPPAPPSAAPPSPLHPRAVQSILRVQEDAAITSKRLAQLPNAFWELADRAQLAGHPTSGSDKIISCHYLNEQTHVRYVRRLVQAFQDQELPEPTSYVNGEPLWLIFKLPQGFELHLGLMLDVKLPRKNIADTLLAYLKE